MDGDFFFITWQPWKNGVVCNFFDRINVSTLLLWIKGYLQIINEMEKFFSLYNCNTNKTHAICPIIAFKMYIWCAIISIHIGPWNEQNTIPSNINNVNDTKH